MFDTYSISKQDALSFCITFVAIFIIFSLFIPIGWVGEIVPFWGPIPTTSLQEPISCIQDLCLFPTRPVMRWGEFPLMLNVYTPAFPDWFQWISFQLSGSKYLIRVGQVFFAALSLSIFRKWSTIWLNGYWSWLFIALLLVDWNWIFYRKALGNTEILLQSGWLMCAIGIWKQLTQKDGTRWVLFGLILGIWSKITFVFLMAPIALVLIWKRNNLKGLLRPIMLGLVIGIVPYTLVLLWTYQVDIPIRSHDFWHLQWDRITHALQGSSVSKRENSSNWVLWLLDPLAFFEMAYGVPSKSWMGWVKGIFIGSILSVAWRRRSDQSIQVLGILLLTQIMVLSFVAQDIHHIVIATPLFWIWCSLVLMRTQSNLKYCFVAVMISFQMVMVYQGRQQILDVTTPTFSAINQQELVSILQDNNVQELVTMDYEVYGILELETPEIIVNHKWPMISTERWNALPSILQSSENKHLLVIDSSMTMIYNLQPTRDRLIKSSQKLGLTATLVDDSAKGVHLYWITK